LAVRSHRPHQFPQRTDEAVEALILAERRLHRTWGVGAPRAPRIPLRSLWQSGNIGDIGHAPGALSLFDK